jgi:hypothetical protein
MSAFTIIIISSILAVLNGLLYSYFENRFSKDWLSVVIGVVNSAILFFVIPLNAELVTKELYLGGLLNIPLKIHVSYFNIVLATFSYLLGCWTVSGYSIKSKTKSTTYPLLNLFLLLAFLVEDIFVKIIILELLILINSISYFTKRFEAQKRFTLILNSFCLCSTLLMLVMRLTEDIEVHRAMFNGTLFVYLIFRLGILREFFIPSFNKKDNTAGEVEQFFSTIVLVAVVHDFVLGLGWNDVYFQNFAFLALVIFASVLYFILNRTLTSRFMRLSQLKYMFLILAMIVKTSESAGLLPFIQLYVFYFVWELLNKVDHQNSLVEKIKWFLVIVLIGPIPLLPLQKELISNVKQMYVADTLNGIVASMAVVVMLSLIPAGMFERKEGALS